MKFLSFLIKVILIIIWAFLLFYIGKAMGITFSPEEVSGNRSMFRLIMGVLILVGAYFILKIDLFKKPRK
jgi:membrane protein DedA with SNARE-associated domain